MECREYEGDGRCEDRKKRLSVVVDVGFAGKRKRFLEKELVSGRERLVAGRTDRQRQFVSSLYFKAGGKMKQRKRNYL